MTAPTEPGDRRPGSPGRPALERPPGERYGGAPRDAVRPPSLARSIALGGGVAVVGAFVFIVLGGILALTAGLLVVAGILGWAIAQAVRARALPDPAARARRWASAVLAFDALALAQVGLWLHARSQGGALGLVDYLAQSRGLLVPLEVAIAVVVAWWASR